MVNFKMLVNFVFVELLLRFCFEGLMGDFVFIYTFRTFINVFNAQCGQSCGEKDSVILHFTV